MEFLKSITGKIVTGLVALSVVAAGISWWQMEPETRQMLLSGSGKIVSWVGIVLVVPWALFFIIARIAKLESNLAGAILVLVITSIELVVLAWLFDWSIPTPTAWTFVVLGGLLAGVYNLLTCDWIAEKLE